MLNRDYWSLPSPSRDKGVRWHTETNMVICPLYRRLRCLLTETIEVSLRHPKTIESDGTQRQIMVIRAPLLSRDNQVRWHAKTIMVIHTLFAIRRQSSPMACGDHHGHSLLLFSRLFSFAIQRRSSPMAHRDKNGHLPPLSKTQMSFDRDYWSLPSPSRDNQFWWHTERNYGHLCTYAYPETIKSNGTWRQIMVICTPFPSRDKRVRWHAETHYGHPPPVNQRQASPLTRRDKYGHLLFCRRLNVYQLRLL